jgi:hypothetical protein
MKYRVCAIVHIDVEAETEPKAVEEARNLIPPHVKVYNVLRPTPLNAVIDLPIRKRSGKVIPVL